MGKVVLYGSVSVDGFVADENEDPDAVVRGDRVLHLRYRVRR